jgi:hypothetical protein
VVDIVINAIDPRVQYTATGGQTNFTFPWAQFAQTDIVVYQTPVNTTAMDSTNLLTYVTNYTVTINAPPAVGGTVTLNVPANAGDIITLIRNMPEARLINYLDGGQFSATQLNTDLDRTVMMAQTNTMFERDVAPHYNTSSIINNNATLLSSGVDTYLPILPPNTFWMKNNANTAIVAVAFAGGGGGAPVILPSVPGTIAIFNDTVGTIRSSAFTLTGGTDGPYSVLTDVLGNGALTAQPALALVASGKNMIINGDFQVWQRGAGGSFTLTLNGATNSYTADRWQGVTTGAGANVTYSQVAGATSGSYLMKIKRTAGNADTGFIVLETSLTRDMCIGSANNVLSVSFVAKAGANYSGFASTLGLQVFYGTGNTDVSNATTGFTGSTSQLLASVPITVALTKFSYVVPALPANATQLALRFFYTGTGIAGADDSFYLTDCKLEISPIATAYDRRPFAQELFESQFFYQKSFRYGTAPAQNVGVHLGDSTWISAIAGANMQFSPSINLARQMIIPVSLANTTFFNPQAANGQVYDYTAAASTTVTTFGNGSEDRFILNYVGAAGTIAGSVMGVHWEIDADLY